MEINQLKQGLLNAILPRDVMDLVVDSPVLSDITDQEARAIGPPRIALLINLAAPAAPGNPFLSACRAE
jgi:hypothetical protein